MLPQVNTGIVPALGQALIPVGEEGAALGDDAVFHSHIQQGSFLADPFAVDNVKFSHAERRGHFVLDHLDLGVVTDNFRAVLQSFSLADIQPDGGIELQRAAAGRRFRIAVHHADLLTQLVDENHRTIGFAYDCR